MLGYQFPFLHCLTCDAYDYHGSFLRRIFLQLLVQFIINLFSFPLVPPFHYYIWFFIPILRTRILIGVWYGCYRELCSLAYLPQGFYSYPTNSVWDIYVTSYWCPYLYAQPIKFVLWTLFFQHDLLWHQIIFLYFVLCIDSSRALIITLNNYQIWFMKNEIAVIISIPLTIWIYATV